MSRDENHPPDRIPPIEFPQDCPPDEAWWERELFRNGKLIDKYMDVLGDEPDWDKWRNPGDLYNKVHFGIDPSEFADGADDVTETDERKEQGDDDPAVDVDEALFGMDGDDSEADFDSEDTPSDDEHGEPNTADADDPFGDDDDQDIDPEVDDAGYIEVKRLAFDFAVRVMKTKGWPEVAELLPLHAGKVGAHLAGGHGLGYEDDAICGNIVKCRWALADAEFCRETLEHLLARANDPRYAEFLDPCRTLIGLITDRIARLRARVWW